MVRLWRETTGSAWRGQIGHGPDRETAYFATLTQAEEFIQRFVPGIDLPADPADPDLDAE